MATKYVTLSQTQTVANGVLAKVRAKGYAVASDLGALASKDEVAKTDLASALVSELEGKADSADLGSLAALNEVAEANLESNLATKINGKADAATTIAGYGITDAYTKTEVDNAIGEAQASVLKPGGSLNAAEVVSTLLVEGNLGKVYNLNENITTTSDFVDGAGHVITAGTNIYVVDTDTTGESPVYKFDVLAGEYGVATQSANGLMSSTDKAKLDNADVTAYTGTGAVNITNHVVSVAAASASASGVGGNAGTMSAADKEKLDDISTATAQEIADLVDGLDNL